MILRTTVDWEQTKEMTEHEREVMEARAEFDPTYNPHADDSLFESTVKSAIIDTDNDKLYIQISDEKLCMTKLLAGEYFALDNGEIERVEERLYFKSTLDEIYEKLTN